MFDEADGLQNNLNRWYDSKTGRWLSQDPIGFAGGDTNLSRYVRNAPTNFSDPSGLAPGANSASNKAIRDFQRRMFNYTQALIREMYGEGMDLFSGPCAPKTTINWGRLSWAMFYFMNEYSDFRWWSVVNGTSLNLHAYIVTGWVPIWIDADLFDGTATGLGRELIHETLHDWMQYGFDLNLFNYRGTRESSHETIDQILADFDDFLMLLKMPDCSGTSPWDRIMKKLGQPPEAPAVQ